MPDWIWRVSYGRGPTNNILAVGLDARVILYDCIARRQVADLHGPRAGSLGPSQCLEWSPNGRQLLMELGDRLAIYNWDTKMLLVQQDERFRRAVIVDSGWTFTYVAWAPDSARFAVLTYSGVIIFDCSFNILESYPKLDWSPEDYNWTPGKDRDVDWFCEIASKPILWHPSGSRIFRCKSTGLVSLELDSKVEETLPVKFGGIVYSLALLTGKTEYLVFHAKNGSLSLFNLKSKKIEAEMTIDSEYFDEIMGIVTVPSTGLIYINLGTTGNRDKGPILEVDMIQRTVKTLIVPPTTFQFNFSINEAGNQLCTIWGVENKEIAFFDFTKKNTSEI